MSHSEFNPGNEEAAFLQAITGSDGTINLSTLTKIDGGGTHDVYRSDKHPAMLLKVMHHSIGRDEAELTDRIQKLSQQYAVLYATFGTTRCITEQRSLAKIKPDTNDNPAQAAIVSIVRFEPCFASKEKFGFNVVSAETDAITVNKKRYLYGVANLTLMGGNKKASAYVIKNYPQLNRNFEHIFKLLDTDKNLVNVMREFLSKYKQYYKTEGILLDTVGLDNVLFYKTEAGWQFKLGSVIKHDTGALTKKTLANIVANLGSAVDTFESYTSVYFMPACIRALNACAQKIGMDKIVDDIQLDDKTIDALSKVYTMLEKNERALNCADHGEFANALTFYNEYMQTQKVSETRNNTYLRLTLGTSYWNHLQKGGKAESRGEVEAYLAMLTDKRNKIIDSKKQSIEIAIDGLTKSLSQFDHVSRMTK